MYRGGEVGLRSGRSEEDDGMPEEDGHGAGTVRKKRRNRGPRGNTGRSGGEGKGEVRRREDTYEITVPQITWMGREYVQELRCLRHTNTRRTRRVQLEMS